MEDPGVDSEAMGEGVSVSSWVRRADATKVTCPKGHVTSLSHYNEHLLNVDGIFDRRIRSEMVACAKRKVLRRWGGT